MDRCIKIPPRLGGLKRQHVSSHSFYESGLSACPWVLMTQGLSQGCNKVSAELTIMAGLHLGRICFQVHLHGCLGSVPGGLLGWGPQFYISWLEAILSLPSPEPLHKAGHDTAVIPQSQRGCVQNRSQHLLQPNLPNDITFVIFSSLESLSPDHTHRKGRGAQGSIYQEVGVILERA